MNKKIILSLFIILCLLTSINIVLADENASGDTSVDEVDGKLSAAPTTEVSSDAPVKASAPSNDIKIDLKIIWKVDSVPDFVEVNILKDGSIVKTVALSEDNEWKATVELPAYDDAGNEITYEVEEVDSDGFDVSYDGNQETGFIITNAPAKLGASNDDAVVADGQLEPGVNYDITPADDGGSDDGGSDNPTGSDDVANVGGSDDGQVEEGDSSDDAPIADSTADDTNSSSDDTNSSSKDTNNTQPVNKTIKVVKKVVKAQDKHEPKEIPRAGNPVAILVLVLMGIVFASIRSRRD